jgi:adenosylmethionine-8-amino-7-oxononanoate aminotransferase
MWDTDGRVFIDGISSWYCAVYGHCHPRIQEAVQKQSKRLDQVVFSSFTHEPAVRLAEELIEMLPDNQEKVFFSDNGSTATEVAIKLSLQYHFNQGQRKSVLLAFEDGFHGDTFGAMSVSGLSVYNGPFEDFFLRVERIPLPTPENIDDVLNRLEEILSTGEVAAFIYEPIVQGAAGMKIYQASLLDRILKKIHAHGALAIADEVMTGFGKTGELFASNYPAEQPDLICLSKALSAGMLPLAATSCTSEVFATFYDDSLSRGFFHGHTYTANPVACAAALAGLELLRSVEIQEGILRISRSHAEFHREMKEHPMVRNSRHLGVIYAMECAVGMERYGPVRDKLYQYFMDNGAFLRPLGSTVYLLPPYVTTTDELEELYAVVRGALQKLQDDEL